jgi:hypothetical protein
MGREGRAHRSASRPLTIAGKPEEGESGEPGGRKESRRNIREEKK